jgi:hypothetical protein
MFRTCPRTSSAASSARRRRPVAIFSAALLSAAGLLWDGTQAPAAAQAYNGGPNQVIVNMDVLNAMPGGYGAPAYGQGVYGQGAYGQPGYSQAPQSQFIAPQGYAPQGYAPQGYAQGGYAQGGYAAPLGAPRYLPPYTPYGMGAANALPLAPGLAGLAVPPARQPSSVLTTLGPDGRPIQPIQLKQPGSTAKAAKPKKKETYAAPAQASGAADEPMTESIAESVPADDQVAAVTPPAPPAEPAAMPDEVPMPEATPPAPATGASVTAAPAAPEPPAPEESAAEEPAAEEATAPEAEAPAEAASGDEPAAPAEEATEEATEETAAVEAPAEPDNSAPAAPIPQGGIRIVFPADLNEVPTEANAALDDLAGQMLADESMRIQIMCYAGGTEETESKARRKSLARCINIRQYLFKKDVRTTRMDVRALGLKSEGQPADRVDIVPAGS